MGENLISNLRQEARLLINVFALPLPPSLSRRISFERDQYTRYRRTYATKGRDEGN